jgi:hypothetical protein
VAADLWRIWMWSLRGQLLPQSLAARKYVARHLRAIQTLLQPILFCYIRDHIVHTILRRSYYNNTAAAVLSKSYYDNTATRRPPCYCATVIIVIILQPQCCATVKITMLQPPCCATIMFLTTRCLYLDHIPSLCVEV